MMLLGSLVFIYIVLHLKDFWWYYKVGGDYQFEIDANGNKDLFALVIEQFQSPLTVGIYLIGLAGLAIHLWHGFQSAFQTLGIEHKRYSPLIKFLGRAYSIIVPLAFASMPVWVYFFK
jgi:succinate dehydrogenase / fumarate reductase cytochrome b subunit